MSSTIAAENILIRLIGTDNGDPVILDNIRCFASDHKASALITVAGEVLFSSNQGTKMSLISGVQTLKEKLGLSNLPMHVTHFKQLPKDYLLDLFPYGYSEAKIRQTIGDKFKKPFLSVVVNQSRWCCWFEYECLDSWYNGREIVHGLAFKFVAFICPISTLEKHQNYHIIQAAKTKNVDYSDVGYIWEAQKHAWYQ